MAEYDDDGAHETLQIVRPQAAEIERVWATYWQPMFREGGMPKLKAELYEYYWLVDQARAVYRHITGGLLDNLGASAEGVIAVAEHRIEQRTEDLRERIRELEWQMQRG